MSTMYDIMLRIVICNYLAINLIIHSCSISTFRLYCDVVLRNTRGEQGLLGFTQTLVSASTFIFYFMVCNLHFR